ncbi:MAG: deoxynucleoside kinase [Hymenobacter sp.]
MHIAIVGNIGAGKTTLAHKLAHHFRWEVFLEEVGRQPVPQETSTHDMPRWAFHLQVYFLNGRFRQTQRIQTLSAGRQERGAGPHHLRGRPHLRRQPAPVGPARPRGLPTTMRPV